MAATLVVTSPTRLCAFQWYRLMGGKVACSRTAPERTTYAYFLVVRSLTELFNEFHVPAAVIYIFKDRQQPRGLDLAVWVSLYDWPTELGFVCESEKD